MRLGIDLMGSDSSPVSILETIEQVSEQLHFQSKKVQLVAIATKEFIQELDSKGRMTIIDLIQAESVIQMEEPPLIAIRRKKEASMNIGIRLLKEGKLNGFISMGNTGALMASSIIQLGRLPYVERPALMVHLPNDKEGVVVLDVGANLNPKPQHLLAYALMGCAFRRDVHQIKNPRIGLLNIGTEQQKGTQDLKECFQLFAKVFGNQFVGNIEGKEVFSGAVDVLVTDGFTGNVFLKTCEGITSFLTDYLSAQFPEGIEGSLRPIVRHLYERFNYSQHPGALLCGVNGVVVKCHGYSNRQALTSGILGAIDLVERDVIKKMSQFLSEFESSSFN